MSKAKSCTRSKDWNVDLSIRTRIIKVQQADSVAAGTQVVDLQRGAAQFFDAVRGVQAALYSLGVVLDGKLPPLSLSLYRIGYNKPV